MNAIKQLFIPESPTTYKLGHQIKYFDRFLLKPRLYIQVSFHIFILASIFIFTYLSSYTCKVNNQPAHRFACSEVLGNEHVCSTNFETCGTIPQENIPIQCGAGCHLSSSWAPKFVGPKRVKNVPIVIGANDHGYRGDSFVCTSAVHAGMINSFFGGAILLKS